VIDLAAPLPLALEVGGTLKTVIGVIMALSGLGVLLMGVIATADKALQKGAIAMGLGAGLIAVGLWLVGAL
jgi:hypothetical protein